MHHYQIGKLQGASTCERPNCRVAKRGFEVAGYQSREGPSCRSGMSRHARGRKRADELLLERRPTCRGAEVGPSTCGVAPEPEEVRGRWRRATSRGGARVQEAEARLGSDAGVQEEVVDARPSEVKEAALGEGGEQGRRRRHLVTRRIGARGRGDGGRAVMGLGIGSSSEASRDARGACGRWDGVRWRD
jgi:hypothetical protein